MSSLENSKHVSVLFEETMGLLTDDMNRAAKIRFAVDCTLGGGGHSQGLLEALPDAVVLGIDRDPLALERAQLKLAPWEDRFCGLQGRFSELPAHLREFSRTSFAEGLPKSSDGTPLADAVIVDLGLSSDQLDDRERGFSFYSQGPLDMRMDPKSELSAERILNEYSLGALRAVFEQGGVGALSAALAKEVLSERPIRDTSHLVEICSRVMIRKRRSKRSVQDSGRHHPATVPFQALRMAVNEETKELRCFLENVYSCLSPQGRLAVISFHSLEDRAVTQAMRRWSRVPSEPQGLPQALSSGPEGRLLTPSAVVPGSEEIESNPRARSARLRVFEKSAVVADRKM